MSTHDIELPQGYAERPFDYSGDLYTEGQVRAIIEANRQRRGEPVGYHPCTSILIEGLKRLPGGSAILAEWDKARSKVDVPQPAGPVNKTGWNVELASWSDEDFVQVFHERPDLADRLRKVLAKPVKVDAKASVPSDDEILFTMRHLERYLKCIDDAIPALLSTARALLARYGQAAHQGDSNET